VQEHKKVSKVLVKMCTFYRTACTVMYIKSFRLYTWQGIRRKRLGYRKGEWGWNEDAWIEYRDKGLYSAGIL
jgi:hypothetical protein